MDGNFCLRIPVSRALPSRRKTIPFGKTLLFLLDASLLLLLLALAQPLIGQTPVNVPTWRYDTTHEGNNTQETLLTPANVTPSTFGKLFSRAVDGYVYAQPLYVSGLTMGDGLVHNVLFVATEHDSIYAFDADSNGGSDAQPLWQASMLTAAHGAAAGATTMPSSDVGTSDIIPEIGITSTPVINVATQTMYVVSKTKENGAYYQRLHAINIITGAEQANSPVVLSASVAGTGNGSSGGQLAYSSMWQNNRVALNYYNGYVYIASGSHGDNGPWHGWVLGYNATTLAQTGAICLSPNGSGDGIWSSGAGLPIDSGGTAGRMFLVTGNGSYSAYPPYAGASYGDSIVDLNLASGSLIPTDAFTPFNQATLSSSDADQGSGGILMFPDQQGSHTHELMQVGKEGRILILNRDSLGGYAPGGSSNTNALQDITGEMSGLWSTPAYWNGNVYVWGNNDDAKIFQINSGVLNTTYSSASTFNSGFPGASFVISANGTQNGIAWAARTDAYPSNGPEVLYAFDATNLKTVLWESDTNDARDDAGPANKFVVPVVTNGKVYLGAAYQVDVYGLLNSGTIAAAPAISPNGGVFGTPQTVSLSTASPNASIYYTLDGSVPTTTSSLYTAPITISSNTVLKAIATGTGYVQSAVASATFTFTTQTPSPVFTPAGGNYSTAQQVTLSDADSNAAIYYTLDGSTPSASSTRYTGPISAPAATTTTINAIAIDPALQTGNVVSSVYVIQAGGSTINFGSGFSSVAGLTLNGSTINSDDSRLQLTSGANYQAGSVFYNQPINIQAFTTDFTFQLSSALADGFTFTIQNQGVTALGASGGSLGYQGINNSVAVKFDFFNNAGEGTDSTGLYTDGASPTVPATDITSSGVILSSGDSIQAHITYDGVTFTMTLTDVVVNKTYTFSQAINIPQIVGSNTAYVGFTGGTGGESSSQKILSWTYSTQGPSGTTAPPTFTPAAGSYTTPQSITLADATSGAVIYYTTNGTTPTTSSAVYSSAIPVGYGTTTVEALAVAGGVSSAVSSSTYVITQPATPAPVFTPAAGVYASAQSVTITDTDANAVIHYTTNGTTPTASSPVYSAAIPVSSSTTIEAIAIDPALTNSSVTTAAYVISTGVVINYLNGFPSNGGLAINGNAAVASNLLVLTNNGGQDSSVFYNTPVNVQSFITNFTFQLVNAQADGFTFTFQNQGPSAIGQSGGSLGYGSQGTTGGIGQSVAVKFDIYSNAGEGNDSTGVFTDGAYPTTPAIDITPSGIELNSGDTIQAQLSYNGTALVLTLTDTVTNRTFTQSFTVNIPQIVGANTAYVGFTAGTGGLGATQEILSWTYSTGSTAPATAAPVFTPAAGSYTAAQSVSITDSTAGAVIYYTTNGTQPTTSSTVYSGSIPVGAGTTTIEAIALAPSYSQSAVTTGVYKVTLPVTAAPTFTPAAGSYTATQSVTIADATTGAVIYYTTNGTTPTTSSTVYSGAIPVGVGTTTIEALALATGDSQSTVTTGVYKVTLPATATPTFIPAAGSYTSAQSVTITDSTTGAVIYYTTNGTTPTTSSAVYSGAIPVGSGTTTIEALAVAPNYSQSTVATATYKVTTVTATPTFTPAAGNYTTAQSVTIADTTSGAVIYYTTNGTTPTTSSTVYSGAIPVGVGTTTVEALAVATGYSQSAVATAVYKVTPVTAAPTFTPAAGSYTAAQSVTIADTTTGAVIYYTTNGTTPTTSSAVYSGAIPVGAGTTTIEALALAPNYSQSAVTTGVYKVTLPVTATPTFTPAAGSYTTPQSVTIADTTTGAVIYYTTNGTTPTTSSAVYSTAIPVGAGTTTIEALALAPGDSQSTVATATYKVTPVTAAPTFTPAAGTYSAAQSVTIADTTTGAVIYYTTNGTTPTTSSAVYSGAIPVGAGTTTIEALALAPSYSNSTVTTGVYKVTLPVTAAPTFTPAGGNYTTPQSVTLADTTAGAVIYYTTNGTTPTTGSAVYSSAIPVGYGTTTVEALALAPGDSQSTVSTATYVVTQPTTPAPVFTPAAGSYASAQSVTITDTDTSAVIHYTTNGTTPTASSPVYSGAIPVSSSTTISAIAIDPALANSSVTTASYVISTGAVINYSSGFPSTAGLTVNGNSSVANNLLVITNNGGQAGSIFYSNPVNVQSFVTNFTFQLVNAQADGFTFTFQNQGPTALGQSGGSLGYGSQGTTGGITPSVAVKFDIYSNAGEGNDSTGVFTNGAWPTTPAIDITPSGIELNSGDTIQAQLSYNGTALVLTLTDTVTNRTYTQSFTVNIPQIVGANTAYVGFTGGTGGLGATQNILNWTYSSGATAPPTAAPVFTPVAGSYTAVQSVTLADTTAGAVIYYTTNGTTPTTSSAVYSTAIPVGAGNTTIEAIALAPNYSLSSVASATYSVTLPVTPAPTFSPAAGVYSNTQSVAISDSVAGSAIYFTTNGTTPTTSSSLYTSPIQVAATETLEAIAVGPGYAPSTASVAAYTIQTTAPSINFGSGFPNATGLSLNGVSTVTGGNLQVTSATQGYAAGSAWFSTPVNISAFTTDFNFQMLNAVADGLTFTIQGAGPTAIGPYGAALGYGASVPGGTPGIGTSIAIKFDIYNNFGEGSDSTGFYTNGASPTTPADDMTASGVVLASGDLMHAHITYDGTNLVLLLTDTVTSATYTVTDVVNIPTLVGGNTAYVGFTGGTGGGAVTSNIVNWTFSTTGSQAAVAQPTNAQMASTRSLSVKGPLKLASADRRSQRAYLVKDYDDVATPETVTSIAVTAEPRFQPAPGKLPGPTDVVLRSDTPNAVIHYTVDGAQPTSRSFIYHAPIVVSGNALTIKAFAAARGMKDSPVVTGNYRLPGSDK